MSTNGRCGSKNDIANTPMPIVIRDKNIVAKARCCDIPLISRLNTSVRSLPRARLNTFNTATANVLVLMPPPVEFGEAPIHISRIINSTDENCKAPKSTLLNPAVCGVVAVVWNLSESIQPISP